MHFWIDKRAQSCGFGRARVSASLSGNGIGFGHHPRRIGGKSMVTPIHRYAATDFRPHNSNRSSAASAAAVAPAAASTPTATVPTTQLHSNQSSSLIHSQQQHYHQPATLLPHHQQPTVVHNHLSSPISGHHHGSGVVAHHAPHHYQPHMFSHHTQQRPYHQNHATRNHHYHHQSPPQPQPTPHQQQPTLAFQPECHVPIGHFGPIELEQSSLNVASNQLPLSAHPSLAPSGSSVVPNVAGVDSQLLPGHLKCGMWASLALATVFVAVFQGTGLEVLIFCAFSGIFFLAACTISLCRRPRDMLTIAQPPVIGMDQLATSARQMDPQLIIQQHLSHHQQMHNAIVAQNILEVPTIESAALPPPYHIAILLPETDKEPDETPPPAYDKLQI